MIEDQIEILICRYLETTRTCKKKGLSWDDLWQACCVEKRGWWWVTVTRLVVASLLWFIAITLRVRRPQRQVVPANHNHSVNKLDFKSSYEPNSFTQELSNTSFQNNVRQETESPPQCITVAIHIKYYFVYTFRATRGW